MIQVVVDWKLIVDIWNFVVFGVYCLFDVDDVLVVILNG